jgi:TatD DNase family protein
MLIDTHCHLDFPEFDPDRDEVIRSAKSEGIDYMINVGSSLKSSSASLGLAQRYDFIYAAVGIHPHEADKFNQEEFKALNDLAKKDKVVAIGEIGLDYYKNYAQQENQKRLFIHQVNLSRELKLPLVIHSRQAESDTLRVLKEAMPLKAVVHCFSGDENFLKACLELGFFVSFTCNITYKKAENLREIIKIAPLERIFLETDAPYLAPEGLRGKRNQPLNVKYVAGEIARIKALSLEEVARLTSANAKAFFGLK